MKPKNEIEYPRCKRCGRKLLSDESKQLGMGKTCFRKYMNLNNHKPLIPRK